MQKYLVNAAAIHRPLGRALGPMGSYLHATSAASLLPKQGRRRRRGERARAREKVNERAREWGQLGRGERK